VGQLWSPTLRAGVAKGTGARFATCPGDKPGLRAAPSPVPLATPARAR